MIRLKRISINDRDKSTITINCNVDLLFPVSRNFVLSGSQSRRVVWFILTRLSRWLDYAIARARHFHRVCSLVRVACPSLSRPLLSSLPFQSLFSPVRREKERVCCMGPFIFFSPAGALRRRARRADRCRRSHDLRNFPPGHFPRSRGFSRLAPGHYLIFRLETSHPQEKRSGWVAKGGGKSGRPSGLEERSGKCFRVITFVSARTPFLSLISSQAFYPV